MFYLKKVRSYFSDKKIVYVAHHRENKNNLDYLRDKLKYDVIQFEFPFEYQISIIGPRPSVVASFFSSALDNCRLIFDDEIKIVSFRINLEKCPIKDEIESIYDYYKSKENECFQVVSLKAD